jgi:nicotinate-nucleotide--dimethylbenzimidazole phosphoribosyltransferase
MRTDALPEIRALDETARALARARQAQLLKPAGSLGRLEELAIWFAGVTGEERPTVRARTVVAVADHGVASEGVSAYPQSVTAQMLAAFATGHAAICVLAREAGADLVVVDAGVIAPPSGAADVTVGLPAPSGNLAREAALSREDVELALDAGRELAAEAAADGINVLVGGEMGIGNTTPAACIAASLCRLGARDVVGRGSGLDDAGLAAKLAVVESALALHGDVGDDPLELLARLGGGEIAVLCGLALGAGEHGLALLCDGVIASSAIAVACGLRPDLRQRLLAGHRSPEPAHEHLLRLLGLMPVLDLGLRLGEGTGAAAALLLLRAACELHGRMATFEEAGVR